MPGTRRTHHCSGCHRPCKGHSGPLGKNCRIYLAAREAAALGRQMSNVSQSSSNQAETSSPTVSQPVVTTAPGTGADVSVPFINSSAPYDAPGAFSAPLDSGAPSVTTMQSQAPVSSAPTVLNLVPIPWPQYVDGGQIPIPTGPSVPQVGQNVTQAGQGLPQAQAQDTANVNYVNELLPGPSTATIAVTTQVSTAPPLNVVSQAQVRAVNSISGPITTAPNPGQFGANLVYPNYSGAGAQFAFAPYVAQGTQAPPSFGGHPIPSPLWRGQASYTPTTMGVGPQVSYVQNVVQAPNPQPPGVAPSFVSSAPTPGLAASTVFPASYQVAANVSMPASTVGFTVAGPSPPGPISSYNTSFEPAQYWGGNAQALPSSLFRPEAPPQAATNNIHPGAQGAQSRQHLDIGLEYLDQRSIDAALQGECVMLEDFLQSSNCDLDELKSNIDNMGNLQVRSVRTRKCISSVLKWLEAWVAYEMVLCKFFGYAVYYEMARYRAFIIGISQKYKFSSVAAYDLRHRQRLAHAGSFLFSSVDHDLYVTIFDMGSVKSTGKCARCGSGDHFTSECGRAAGPSRGAAGGRSRGQNRGRRGGKGDRNEICYNFQTGGCNWGGNCFRLHKCAGCGSDSPQSTCSNSNCKAAVSKAANSAASS